MNIYRLTYCITPRQDIVLPSITSRLVKQIFVKSLRENGLEKIAELFMSKTELSRTPVKPVRVTFIYRRQSDSTEFLWCEYERRPVIRKGVNYYFDIVVFETDSYAYRGIVINADTVLKILDSISGEYEVFNMGTVEVKLQEVNVVSERDLEPDDDYDTVLIEFKTPTLLQYPKHPRLRDYPSRHTLYPQPMLTVLSLVYKWNNLVKRNYVSLSHVLFAPYEIIEVNHCIKPVTIQFRKLRERGFVGWVKYGIDSRSEKRRLTYLKLFNFSKFSGIGRSSNIGLGEVCIKFDKRKK